MTTLAASSISSRAGAKSSAAPYWNPYAAGFGLGLVLLAAYLVAGRGLGATGAFSSVAAWLANAISPEHAQASAVHARYLESGPPLTAWLTWLLIGTFIGAAVSGLAAGRFAISVEKGPRVTDGQRLALALAGGIIAGLGAKIARGCTSGQALTGASILNPGSLVFMLAVFVAGYAVAWTYRKEWL
ncbi:MAG TPA: YeeE/YedE thiosulfate transporter family protein [Usitatibacteraceae bacterium]|nr:YeeE/YedE thiosulfate transporter family protein [Usitatibacteraceae bacterium]